MGVVYLAEKVATGERVALKVLSPGLSESIRNLDRFHREAQITTRLRHSNIVPTLEAGESGGQVFFAMEYVEGTNLAQVVAALQKKGTKGLPRVVLASVVGELLGDAPVPGVDVPSGRHSGYFGAIARLFAQIADALEYAHGQDVIHRDVKPGNILLRRDLHPLLADFGLAKDVTAASLTRSGDLVGTYHYLSPEQAMSGRIPVTPRADVYSLGVTLYEAITLAVPFQGDSAPKVLQEIAFQDPPDPRRLNPAIPTPLAAIALAAMEKRPDRRYGSAAEMAEDLRRFLRFEPISRRLPGPLRRAARWVRRHPIPVGAAAILLVGVGAFAGVRGAMLDDQLDRCAIAEEGGDLRAARDCYSAFLGDHPDDFRAAAGRERVAARIRERVTQLVTEAKGLMARGGESDFATAASLLQEAVSLEPTPEIQALVKKARGIFPVRIDSHPAGARVIKYRIDGETGGLDEEEVLGVTPLPERDFPLGTYRLLVEIQGFGYAEKTLFVSRGPDRFDVSETIRPTVEVIRDMVRIEGGRYALGDSSPEGSADPPREVEFEGFYLDKTEVTNAAYLEYLRETKTLPPERWATKHGSLRPSKPEEPVTLVDWFEVLAFAEWAGKRLPTEEEWEAACRGTESHRYPWGEDPDESLANSPARMEPGINMGTRKVLPVGSFPGGATRGGLLDMIGNVEEWVWDRWTVRPDAFLARGNPSMRVVRGGECNRPGSCLNRAPADPPSATSHRGFRCAKSVRP
ncbi:MAG: SUMF1/EgtB/PvdO family nonheme iron enzyme [Planctomycetes bacterium]|nr:SUMF1/EgtB/PvdO family nonheme iron enzyme [Planctomycetota bacterium]